MNVTQAGGIFGRLDNEWAALCADPEVRGAVYEWLMADCLAVEVAAVTDPWVRTLGPEQLLAALRPADRSLPTRCPMRCCARC
ncbi:hypothetical protein [Streptomyces sp. NPDC048196]|uniref:hypothetical protein n=1 Tax=Streptomyces sp. NPDC048196 TaxID=3154712 RepID=UPI0033CD9EB8